MLAHVAPSTPGTKAQLDQHNSSLRNTSWTPQITPTDQKVECSSHSERALRLPGSWLGSELQASMCTTTYNLPDMKTWMALTELSKPGDSIRERRIELGWTQAELAKRCGTPQADISRIENGRLDARWSTIQRISKALATTPARPGRTVANGGRIAAEPVSPSKKWSAKGTTIAITPAKK